MILSVKCYERGSFCFHDDEFVIEVNFRDIGKDLKPVDYFKVFYFKDSLEFSNSILHYIHIFFPNSCNHLFESDFVYDFDILCNYFSKLNSCIGSKVFFVD